jgi:hypothetical protein
MTFVHGSGMIVLVNGKVVSSEVSGVTVAHSRAVSETTCMGQSAGAAGANFVPGLMSGSMALRGPQNPDPTLGLTKEIQDAIGVDNVFLVTALPDTTAIGKPAMFALGDPSDWSVDANVADAVAMTFTAQADESVEMGWVLAALQAYTADALTGTAVDRGTPGTPTTRGLVAAIHVTAFSGFTGVVVKVQHSPDNSTWADLATFTTVTAVGRERVKVANGTTVNRYLRASVDVTGSGSITLMMVAAPR